MSKRTNWIVLLLTAVFATVSPNSTRGFRPHVVGPSMKHSVLREPQPTFPRAEERSVEPALFQEMMRSARIIAGTGGQLVVDTTMRIPPELVSDIARAPYIRALSDEMNRINEDFKSSLVRLEPKIKDVDYAGVGLGGGYVALNITAELSSGRVWSGILVNPYRLAEEIEAWVGLGLDPAEAPREFAGRLVAVILHELAHRSSRQHDEIFAATLTRHYGATIVEASTALARLRERIDHAAYRQIVSDLDRLKPEWGGEDLLASVPSSIRCTGVTRETRTASPSAGARRRGNF